MNSYKVYLTKSGEAATRIARSFGGDDMTEDIKSISHGQAHKDNELIPAVFGGKNYHYCIVELKQVNEDNAPTYELIIC